MEYEVEHVINGQKTPGSGKKLEIFNPALGEKSGFIRSADGALIDKTVQAAQTAFSSWSQTSPTYRANLLFRFKHLVDQSIDELAALVTKEHGKTLIEAKGSIQRGIAVLDYACGIPNLLKGTIANNVTAGMDCYSMHQPLGVCVGITPFNFPAMIPLWMFPMAIACGNTFVLKPSEKDPSCPHKLVELAHEAGIPPGVVNIVHGGKETVDALLLHPLVKAISFVGSTPVAEHVYKRGIDAGKRVQAFGGAKNHCIIMPDADMNQAAKALTEAAFGSAGERCMALSVVLTVGENTAEHLLSLMKPLVDKLRVGPGQDKATDIGPLVTSEHRDKVKSYIQIGIDEGAKLLIDGRNFTHDVHDKGFYLAPTIFDHVTPNMRIYKEEIFGPVLCIVRVPDYKTALKMINDHEYGNGTAIFTRDGYIARQFTEEVEAGMVGVNVPIPVPVAYQSFGGWKRSIFSDIGMYGSESIRFYTKLKTVTQRWFPKDI